MLTRAGGLVAREQRENLHCELENVGLFIVFGG